MDTDTKNRMYILGLMLKITDQDIEGGILSDNKRDEVRSAMHIPRVRFNHTLETLSYEGLLRASEYDGVVGIELTPKGTIRAESETSRDFVLADIEFEEKIQAGLSVVRGARAETSGVTAQADTRTAVVEARSTYTSTNTHEEPSAGTAIQPTSSGHSIGSDQVDLGAGPGLDIHDAKHGGSAGTVNETASQQDGRSPALLLTVQRDQKLIECMVLLDLAKRVQSDTPEGPNSPEAQAQLELLNQLVPWLESIQQTLADPDVDAGEVEQGAQNLWKELQAIFREQIAKPEIREGLFVGTIGTLSIGVFSLVGVTLPAVISGALIMGVMSENAREASRSIAEWVKDKIGN